MRLIYLPLARSFAVLATLFCVGCANAPAQQDAAAADDTNDPLEPVNRVIFDGNQVLDHYVLRPVAVGYVTVVPDGARDAIRRALDNMKEPANFINNVLQGNVSAAGTTVARFAVNTTMGFGGLFDVASEVELPRQRADFGQTLYTWGFGEGPYIVLPIFGPSNVRDAIGLGIDSLADPTRYTLSSGGLQDVSYGIMALDGTDERGRVIDALDDLEKHALDYYALMRSLARQRRADELGVSPLIKIELEKRALYDDPDAPRVQATAPAAARPQPH